MNMAEHNMALDAENKRLKAELATLKSKAAAAPAAAAKTKAEQLRAMPAGSPEAVAYYRQHSKEIDAENRRG